MAINIKGSIVALVTPFNADGSVDFGALGELMDWHVESGTDAILVLGTTGETATMTDKEDEAVCDFAVKRANGRVPVLAGSGSNCTATMLKKSLTYQGLGAEGLLLVSPYYNKTNKEGMYRHFAMVADAVKVPCILYNIPGRTGCSITIDVVKRLAQHENIAAIKEASGDITYMTEVAKFLSDEFVMYSGNDDMTVPIMALGGVGVISVWANIMPAETHEMTARYLAGDHAGAMKMQLHYLELIKNLFIEVNPIPVKTALGMMGRCTGALRLPLYEMAESNRAILEASLRKAGLL